YLNNLGATAVTGISTNRPGAHHYDLSSGLRSDFVYALAGDGRGRVFVGTDRGIDMLEEGRWRHYGTAEGLVWNDINTSAMLPDSQGSLWIGTSRGLSRFRPDREYRSTLQPVPIVTRVSVLGREQSLSGPIQIPY